MSKEEIRVVLRLLNSLEITRGLFGIDFSEKLKIAFDVMAGSILNQTIILEYIFIPFRHTN